MTKINNKTPKTQGDYEVGHKKPPKNRQFGQPEGNPRGHGFWKKEESLRWKLQQVAKMTSEELKDLLSSPEVGEFEKNAARTILEMSTVDPNKRWQILEGLTNQDSGYPKQQVEQKNIELKPILPKLNKKKESKKDNAVIR